MFRPRLHSSPEHAHTHMHTLQLWPDFTLRRRGTLALESCAEEATARGPVFARVTTLAVVVLTPPSDGVEARERAWPDHPQVASGDNPTLTEVPQLARRYPESWPGNPPGS
ncbi:hypothetical protein ISCGN_032090 [Ixodes scapularis]